MKSSPPTYSRDLSEHPGDKPGDRLARVAASHSLPGTGKTRGEPVHVAAEPQEPTAEDIERIRVVRTESLAKLRPRPKVKLRKVK